MPDLTLSDLKNYLGNLTGDDRDTQLQLIVNGVNSRIVHATSRDWKQETRIETYRGTGTDALVLRHYPAPLLISLTENGDEIDVDDEDTVSLNKVEGILYKTDGSVWELSRKQNIAVTYTGGPDTVPPDLRIAALEMAKFVYQASGGRIDVTAGTGGASVSLYDKAMESLPTVKAAITDHTDWVRGFYRGG